MLKKLGLSLYCYVALFSISLEKPVLDDLPKVTSTIALANAKLI